MTIISRKMTTATAGASLVRKMFEEGARLRASLGPDKVFDFSIGNPDLPPPPVFQKTLARLVAEARPGAHGYMPNSGWPEVRAKVAAHLNRTEGAGLKNPFTADQVIMTVGAAGALNIILKAILDPGDEVVTPRPYFMEYNYYADNHGAAIVPAEPGPAFRLNLESIAEKIGPKTRAVLINSPHNPTGVIYRAEELAALGRLLTSAGQRHGRPIFLVSDEPYRKLAYDGLKVPSVFAAYPYSVIGTSFSKDMSVPGERIGYAAINPDLPDHQSLFNAMALANRILGFVNAPSLMQLALADLLEESVDIGLYEQRRNILADGLAGLGYQLTRPEGAFYLFPRSPLANDDDFVNLLKEENILTVPGRGFSLPGYFRICYCLPPDMIKNSLPGFARALAKAKG
ncbi:MAG: pyridoxal phosphate-dependent aminotransferase [Candidatus Adiutrix sp.]|jgi:aspartate aminotransferase|nr:pyridoxal phosphate-dependent aminotransferase [Candidatus Adiutrix sp.]